MTTIVGPEREDTVNCRPAAAGGAAERHEVTVIALGPPGVPAVLPIG